MPCDKVHIIVCLHNTVINMCIYTYIYIHIYTYIYRHTHTFNSLNSDFYFYSLWIVYHFMISSILYQLHIFSCSNDYFYFDVILDFCCIP